MKNNTPGVLEQAITKEKRNAFIRYKTGNETWHDEETDRMVSYIASDECVRDLKSLMQQDYSFVPPPHHYRVPKNFSGPNGMSIRAKGPSAIC